MLFRDWMAKHDDTRAGVALRLGVHRTTVQRWIAGSDMPRPEVINSVTRLSMGAVTYADFAEAYNRFREGAAAQSRESWTAPLRANTQEVKQ